MITVAVIRTYHLPATETKGSRIRSRYGQSTITRPFPYEARDAHEDAAREMAERLYGEGVQVRRVGEHARGYNWAPVEGTYDV